MRIAELLGEGMGGSSGGGTAGSAGAGGSSLGLPYPSTYEEENDKFKTFHPINKNKRPMHNLSMTTEEENEPETLNPPSINVGDEVKVGKFKNSKATVKGSFYSNRKKAKKDDEYNSSENVSRGDPKPVRPKKRKQ